MRPASRDVPGEHAHPISNPRRLRIDVDRKRVVRVRRALLRWACHGGRHFFWRDPTVTPFQVLVTEILLSKTRAEVVEPIAKELFKRFPNAVRLKKASQRSLERLLYPLGLHRKRARSLIQCASSLTDSHNGEVPETVSDLMQLPSVGRYAATATVSVAFHQRLAVVDANVARVYARVFSLPAAPPRLSTAHDLWDFAQRMLPAKQSRAYNWAILDLGGTVCTAKNPLCNRCPLVRDCDFGMHVRPHQASTGLRSKSQL